MKAKRPIIGITVGDPAGIGPEVVIKALLKSEVYNICKPVLIGDLKLLEKIAKGPLKVYVSFKP